MERGLARVADWTRSRERISVVMILDARPLFVVGPGNFLDEMIKLAGGFNLVTAGGAFPTIDMERLLTLNPEVIIDASAMATQADSTLGDAPAWSGLRAVRAGRVHRLATAAALRPGPRLADGLSDLARAIHGAGPIGAESATPEMGHSATTPEGSVSGSKPR